MKAFLALMFLLPPLWSCAQKSKAGFLVRFENPSSHLWGFKTSGGKVVIPAKYSMAFTDTFYKIAFVADNSRLLAIDKTGKILLQPYNFDNGPDYLSDGLFRFVDHGKMGFANKNCKIIIPAKFDFVMPFENGFASYAVGGHKETEERFHRHWVGGTWGKINKKGEVVVQAK